jgi:hypothetical protein
MDGVLVMAVIIHLQNQVSVLLANLVHHVKKVQLVVVTKVIVPAMHVVAN